MIPKRRDIEPKFIYYSSINSGFNGYITGSAQPQIVINVLELKRIQLPPISEQKKIVEILSKVDEDIEKTDEIIRQTKNLKKGLMKELLAKGEERRIKDVADINPTNKSIEYTRGKL